MNAGRMITDAMVEQKRRDWTEWMWSSRFLTEKQQHLLRAYVWWGWHISGNGGTGRPMW